MEHSTGFLLTFYPQSHILTKLRRKASEDIVEKEEIAGSQHFLLFPQFDQPLFLKAFLLLTSKLVIDRNPVVILKVLAGILPTGKTNTKETHFTNF